MVYLQPEQREQFARYHSSVNPYGSPSDTAREMIAAQLASDPAAALHRAARDTARRDALRAANELVRNALRRVADDFASQMPED